MRLKQLRLNCNDVLIRFSLIKFLLVPRQAYPIICCASVCVYELW